MNQFNDLRTARQIASEAGVPFHRVDYVIQRLGLTETARVGIVRLFSPDQQSAILGALASSVVAKPTTPSIAEVS